MIDTPIEIPAVLPTDVTELQRLFIQTVQRFNGCLSELNKSLHEIAILKRYVYGRRSEQLPVFNQTHLFNDTEEDRFCNDPDVIDQEETRVKTIKKRKGKVKGHGRNPLPDHLPRERVEYEPDKNELNCGCGQDKKKMGEEVTEELDYRPGSFFVRVHVRPKYGCPNSDCDSGITIAPVPDRLIDKGLPGPGLVSHILINKFSDHIPLDRQTGMFRREGVWIAKSTMVGWVKSAYEFLLPVGEAIKSEIKGAFCVKSDDTHIKVQMSGKKGTTHRGYMWVYLDGLDRQVYFEYTPTRGRAGPVSFFEGYEGFLQADAYSGYDECFKNGDIAEVGCWAHARRKFYDAQSTDESLCLVMLEKIGALFAIESRARESDIDPAAVKALRGRESRPILDEIKAWLDDKNRLVLPKSPVGQAITYTLNQWTALTRYLEDGRLCIDNNASERAIRAIAIGRKNWMFAGSEEGAKRAALMYTLLGSCKLLEIDPFEYLMDIFSRIHTHPMKKIRELTPLGWKENRERSKSTP